MVGLTEGSDEELDALPKLIELLASSQDCVLIPALRAIGNIAQGGDNLKDTIIQAGGLVYVKVFLQHTSAFVVKEAAYVIRNISAGNNQHKQSLIDIGLIPGVIAILDEVRNFEIIHIKIEYSNIY